MGYFGTKNGSKMDQKCVFPKIFLDHLECTNKWNEPMLSNYGPSQGRKGLENGPIWHHKWLKNGSKPWSSKNDPSPVVVPKRMNTAHFEPLLSLSHPLFYSGSYITDSAEIVVYYWWLTRTALSADWDVMGVAWVVRDSLWNASCAP